MCHHIIHLIAPNLLTRLRRVGTTDTGKEKFQIVVYLGCCTHRRAGITRDNLLLNGDSGSNALNKVNIGLLHTPQELTRIGREALNIATLTLCKYCIKGECRLTRTRQTRNHDKLRVRNLNIHTLKVMHPRPLYFDFVLHRHISLRLTSYLNRSTLDLLQATYKLLGVTLAD